MSKIRKENFMNFLFPYKLKFQKTIIINFLSEIYANYYKRCNKVFDSYTFQELMKLPMIVCNKMYSIFSSGKNEQMTVDQFSTNIFNLFFGDLDDKMSMMFDILDFDGDGAIIYEDVFLILSHLHLIEYNHNTIECLEMIISNFFENKNKIDKENFFNINKNYDVLLLLLMFLNKHQSIISEQELSFYENSLQKQKLKNMEGLLNYKFTCSISNDALNEYRDLEYKPTEILLDYLDIIDFGKKKKKRILEEEAEEEETFENDDNDLNVLLEFSMDFKELKERFMKECHLEPRLFTSTFSSMFQEDIGKKRKKREMEIDKQVNDFIKNQMYKSLKKERNPKKKKKLLIHLKTKKTEESNNEKTTQINSTVADLDKDNYHDYKKTNSFMHNSALNLNYSYIKKINPKFQNKYEIILKKENGKAKRKMVKLILFNNYLFYYITFNNIDFLYKKIIPIVNLFIHKKKIDDLTHIKLISKVHNHTVVKEFSCDDYEKVYNFCLKFNILNYHRDIAKDYYFKYEIDKGKFGHVFLAKSNSDEKKYAIKLVYKNNQSLEEYKINRNEIDIFHLLQKISHPNIVKCIDLYENESQIFFVFEYLSCGNLKKYLEEIKMLPSDYNNETALKLIHQLFEGAYILHKYGIIHRDIKTTNIMIQINSPIKHSIISNVNGIVEKSNIHEDISDVTLKIIDFGLSKILGVNEKTNEPYGSLSYKAPEIILHKQYDFKVDVWSIGITIYYIVYKALPFDEGSREEIKKAIINNTIPFYANNILFDTFYFKNSINIKNNNIKDRNSSIIFSILKDCLTKNPEERYTIEELYYKYCNY